MGKATAISNYAMVVGLTENEAKAIAAAVPGPQSIAEKVADVGGGLVKDFVKGGAMVTPEWAQRIEGAIGTLSPQAIAEAVEKSVNRQGEAVVVPWVVDPTQIAFYQALADNAGITLERQLKTLMDWAYAQGWFGMGAPEVDKLLLTREQYGALQKMFGRDIVTGQDVMDRLLAGGAVEGEEEDDLILGSLKE